jgi:hypothetical protein
VGNILYASNVFGTHCERVGVKDLKLYLEELSCLIYIASALSLLHT